MVFQAVVLAVFRRMAGATYRSTMLAIWKVNNNSQYAQIQSKLLKLNPLHMYLFQWSKPPLVPRYPKAVETPAPLEEEKC